MASILEQSLQPPCTSCKKKIEFSLHVYKTNMKCNINNLRDNTTGKKGRVKHLANLSV